MEIILIVPLIVLAGVFAMAEIALVSVRKPRLQQWANQGNTRAQVALDLANKSGNIPRDGSDGHDAHRHLCRSFW